MVEHQEALVEETAKKLDRSIVYKIEEAEFPGFEGDIAPLPDNSNYAKVVDSIVKTLLARSKVSEEILNLWKAYFNEKETITIISNMFWYCILKMKEEERDKRLIRSSEIDTAGICKQLLEKISYNYIELFIKIPHELKEIRFQKFYSAVAQGVFCSMFFAFPKSRSKINDDDVKMMIFRSVGDCIAGMELSHKGFYKWNLDLGHGNELDKPKPKEEGKDPVLLLPQIKAKKPMERRLVSMQYSPLVMKYLKTNKYQTLNSVPVWNIRYTFRNIERERETDRKFDYYRNLTVECDRRMRKRLKKIEDMRKHVGLSATRT